MSQQQWCISTGVAVTALAAAAGRAVESSRADRLFDDPLAAAFVAAARSPMPVRWPRAGDTPSDQELLLLYGAGYVGLRTRFVDDQLTGAQQVVLLAAGLDTRAFRLDWPGGTHVFEIDKPGVLEFKNSVLHKENATARCARTAVAADLRGDWAAALVDARFDPAAPTAWVAEGLLQYLPADAEEALFDRIRDLSAPGSRLVVERTVNLASLVQDGAQLRDLSRRTGIPMDRLIDTEARTDPAARLAGAGWTVTDEAVPDIAARYHRGLADPGLPRPAAPAPAQVAAGAVRTSLLCAQLSG